MQWDMPKCFMTNQFGWGEIVPAIAYGWYIEGPDKKILFDTSSRAELLRFAPWKNLTTPEEKLKEFGLKPSDIDIVIVSHLYYEHIGYGTKYSKAKFYVQRKEYEFAMNPHSAYAFYYDKRQFEDIKFDLIEGDQEIVKGVKTMFTPGHTPGCQSLLVETSKGIAGITGFCCINQNYEPPVPMHTKDNIINIGMYYNPLESYDNMLKFRDACDIIIPNHDPEHASKDRIPEPDVVYTSYHKVR
jgi:glyoxylase-like metal-dependent hydrolase (beta-lactamase superfamily II)